MSGGGAYCKPCVLFGKASSQRGGVRAPGAFVSLPLNKYKKAVAMIKDHEMTQYHIYAAVDAENFVKWYENRVTRDIRNIADSGKRSENKR